MKIDYQKFFIACARANCKTTDLLAKASLSSGVLSKIRAGENVSAVTVGKLAKALGVDVTELLAIEK